jgi:TetR/AcrR family transcriptional regulator
MKQKDHDQERRIMEAAKQVFHKRGYFGARMQDIADEAGINKAMLHYYFRNKDNIFEAVFQEAIGKVFGRIMSSFAINGSMQEKLVAFADSYIDLLISEPYIPAFVIHEINHNPERIKTFLSETINVDPKILVNMINNDIDQGKIRNIDPIQIILTMISSAIFPFIGKPILMELFKINENEFINLMQERKRIIPEIIMSGIKI